MISYEKNGKLAYFNGLRFYRDDKTGYYLNSTIRKRLHRYVWEHHNGSIPKGVHVHHKDFNKSNNDISNLGPLIKKTHLVLHGIEKTLNDEWLEWARKNLTENARPKASEWHGSQAGREWHKKHYQDVKDKLHAREEKACDYCKVKFLGFRRIADRFCSNKCKSAWRRKAGLDDEVRICEYCKTEFETNKYSKQKCCSKTCSNRLFPRLPQLRKN